MRKDKEQIKICDYLLRWLEKAISPEEQSELKEYLKSNPDALELYIGMASLHAQLSAPSKLDLEPKETASEDSVVYMRLLKELGDDERYAEPVAMPKETVQQELIQKVVYHNLNRKKKFTKWEVGSLMAVAASIVFVLLFVHFVPVRSGYEVATLTDSLNAKWADRDMSMQAGERLYAGKSLLLLREGLAELQFDTNARVVIEAPAEFQILADDRIGLTYGKVYAIVPKEATGFSVYTQNTKIIDMGTEFGVQAEVGGNTQLYVLKGKTILVTDSKNNKTNEEVGKGSARMVSGDTGETLDIACKPDLFVRDINSKSNCIWRGQDKIDLADIAGGGNGFETGLRNQGLNPATGEMTDISESAVSRKADNAYHSVQLNPYIDGVFVPNGRTDQIISSRGHVFSECPVTQGNYYTEISSAPKTIDRAEIVLGDVNYSQSESAYLFLHANLGITYDLKAIRSQLAGARVTRFQSIIGISDSSWRPCNADFWILVDGLVRYRKLNVQQKGIIDTVDIELYENDRFLTLVTTDGGDPESRIFGNGIVTNMDSDWCVFAKPVLVLE